MCVCVCVCKPLILCVCVCVRARARARVCMCVCVRKPLILCTPPQRGAEDAEIKVPSSENTALKHSSRKVWNRSVYSHTCYAYCQGFHPCLFLPFPVQYPAFFQNLSRFFLCWLWLTHGSCVGPQNRIGHPAGCRIPC